MDILRSDETNLHTPVSATFDMQTGQILAHLDKVDFGYVDGAVRYQGKVFQPKGELHITIVGKDGELIRKHLENHPDDRDDILDLVLSTDWSYAKLGDFYFIQEKPGVEAIIQMVEIPALREFFKDLSKLVGQGFTLPLTHVTLYTRGTDQSIPILDQQSFEQLAKSRIDSGEVRLEENLPARPGAGQGLAH